MSSQKTFNCFLLASFLLTLHSCSSLPKTGITLGGPQPNAIEVSRKSLFPEGIAYNNKSGKFLLGSFREGAVYEIDSSGDARLFVHDTRLNSVLGLCVDTERNRLLVANADIGSALRPYPGGEKKLASIGIYDLTSGSPLHFVDLGILMPTSKHLANDLTIDSEGNAYVTDSFSPVIYKVNVQGQPSVFLNDDKFAGTGIGLNGIVYHPDGFLIVAKKDDGKLFKVPLKEPKKFSQIGLEKSLIGLDGLILVDRNNLVAVTNATPTLESNTVFALKTVNDWQSANLVGELKIGKVYPTTGTIKDGRIYVVHSKLDTLIAAPTSEKKMLDTTATIEPIGFFNK